MKPEYDQELIDSLEHMSIGNLTKYKYDTYYMYCTNLDKNTRILAHTALEMYNDYEIKYLKNMVWYLKMPKFIQKFYIKYLNKLYYKATIFYKIFYKLVSDKDTKKEQMLNTLMYFTWKKRFEEVGIPIENIDKNFNLTQK